MNINKKNGRIVGALFLTVMVTWLIGDELIGSVLNNSDYLFNVYPNKIKVIIGAFFEIVEVAAVLGIAVMMFPIFKKQNEFLALGYIGFRILECGMLIVGTISSLLLITLSQNFIQAGTIDALYFNTLGELFIAVRVHWSFLMLTTFYGLSALIFYFLMYQLKLIPRFISVWGLIAVTLSLIDRVLLELSGHCAGMISGLPISGLHLGLIEIFLGIWLMVKGFNLSKIPTSTSKYEKL